MGTATTGFHGQRLDKWGPTKPVAMETHSLYLNISYSLTDPLHPQGKTNAELAGTPKQELSNLPSPSHLFPVEAIFQSLTLTLALQGETLEGIVQGFGHLFAMWFSLRWRWMMPVVIIACDKALEEVVYDLQKAIADLRFSVAPSILIKSHQISSNLIHPQQKILQSDLINPPPFWDHSPKTSSTCKGPEGQQLHRSEVQEPDKCCTRIHWDLGGTENMEEICL
jgi:hypothetical protein